MNPNQMMMAKAMVAQEALRDEARRSRRAQSSDQPADETREERAITKRFGIFDTIGLALPGRR